MSALYLIALGSNRRHYRHGAPHKVLRAAIAALGDEVLAVSRIVTSAPLGPARRRYANAAAILRSALQPDRMLAALKRIEARFGRRPGGRRWGERVLDLDIVLWQGGAWSSRGLTVPHVRFRERAFVLGPAAALAPRWRDPVTGATLAQLRARLARRAARPAPLADPALDPHRPAA